MSPSCAPAKLPRTAPKPVGRSTHGLAALFDDPETTWADIERDFGAGTPSKHTSNSRDLVQPLLHTSRVSVGYRHAQNREYLRTLEVTYAKAKLPSVTKVARQLGLYAEVSRADIRRTCTHGSCPAVIVYRAPAMNSQRVIFTLEDAASAAVGQAAATQFRVTQLHFDNIRGGCRTGAPLPEPVALAAPTTGRSKKLSSAMLAVARELKKVSYDENLIQEALAEFGKVQVRDNSMSRFTWVRLFVDDERPIEPICFEGFRYVADPQLMCRIAYPNRHLYEIDGNATHRIFLTVEIKGPFGKPPDHIAHAELTRMPRGWKDIVF